VDVKQTLRGLVIGLALTAAAGLAQAGETTAPAANPPPSTEGTPAASQTTTTKTAAKEDPVVCKKIDAPTGSRMGSRKVCKKASVWKAEQEAAKESVDEAQSSARAQNPSGN